MQFYPSRRRRLPLQVESLEDRVQLSVTISLDYTYDSLGFFSNYPAAKADLQVAAQILSSHLNDTLLAIVPVAGSGNTWQESTFNPGNTALNLVVDNPIVPANTLVIYAGGSHLPSGEGGLGGTGYSSFGTTAWNNLVLGRGQPGALGASPTDNSPWGGAVSFSADVNWNFTPGTLTSVGGDFFGVALHELSHVLGIGTANSWSDQLDATNHLFKGTHSVAAYGSQVPLDPGTGIEVGSPDGHWATGTSSHGLIAVMTPDAGSDLYTQLDWAGLADVGWQVDNLLITSQPPPVVGVGGTFGLTVQAQYPDGYIDTTYNGPITLSLGNNPSNATLGGTLTVMAKQGIATFSDLTLDRVGAAYTLIAATSLYPSATTTPFNAQQNTSITLTAQPNSSVYGQSVNLKAQVSSMVGSPTPTGTVTFKDGSTTIGEVQLDNAGLATLPISTLTVGQHSITAVYSGNSVGSPATSTATMLTVSQASTTTSLGFLPVSPTYGQALMLTATVAVVAPGSGAPSGMVSFFDGTKNIGLATLNGSGIATLSISTLLPGAHPISATYLGSLNDASSASGNSSVPIDLDPTSAVLTTSQSPTIAAQSEQFTATLKSSSGRVPTGTVTFADEAGTLGTAPLIGGIARFTTAALPVGSHTITTSYQGDAIAAPAAPASLPLTVTRASTTVLVTVPSAITFGLPLTLVANVAPVGPGATKPSGTVSFFNGTTLLGSSMVDATGQASLTVPSLSPGTHSISTSYSGDASDLPMTSGASSLYVGDLPKGDFDGDGKADLAVFGKDPFTGRYRFKILTSSSNFQTAINFDNNGFGYGNAQSIPVTGDYFGDGRAAYALFSPNSLGGMTFVAVSSVNSKSLLINFGGPNSIPVVADVDGDGKADFGIYDKIPGYNGYSFDFLLSSNGFSVNQQYVFNNNGFGYGNAQSIPIVADFDGSGKAGFGVYNPSSGGSTFAYVSPSANVSFTRTIGTANDIPGAIDYQADGKADLSLYGPDPAKPGHYRYLVLTSSSGYDPAKAVTFDNFGFGYGNQTAIPVVADYEGNGKADFALFIPDLKGGMEYLYQTSQVGMGIFSDFASAADLPLTASAYWLAKKVRGF